MQNCKSFLTYVHLLPCNLHWIAETHLMVCSLSSWLLWAYTTRTMCTLCISIFHFIVALKCRISLLRAEFSVITQIHVLTCYFLSCIRHSPTSFIQPLIDWLYDSRDLYEGWAALAPSKVLTHYQLHVLETVSVTMSSRKDGSMLPLVTADNSLTSSISDSTLHMLVTLSRICIIYLKYM